MFDITGKHRAMAEHSTKIYLWPSSVLNTFVKRTPVQGRRLICEPRHDKTNKVSVRPAKTQISLGIRPDWSESSMCAQWVAKDPRFLHADSEDSEQTGRMPSLIWVLAGRTLILFCYVVAHVSMVA